MSIINSRSIKQKAAELGFHKVGIVEVCDLAKERDDLEKWLAKGYHGNMAWLERDPDKRSDPRLIMPDARSMVVMAINYFTPAEHDEAENTGKISRYAWGDDYHALIRERLNELLAWIKEVDPSIDGKGCVDTVPIMEKAWAERAGIGWIGKHSNVISREYGSWIFLAELLLDIELDYDTETVPDHCGSCTACIDLCPTGAIVEPYVIDANRCISYSTIELRDETLPQNITDKLDGWIYGCDVCQNVCPWNRFEKPTDESAFFPRNDITDLDLDEVLNLDHEAYVERFRGSAMKRTKLAGLQRNAAALKQSPNKNNEKK